MSKFKIKLKLTGLEVEIEGTRDDVPLIGQAVNQQLGQLLLPATNIVDGELASSGSDKKPLDNIASVQGEVVARKIATKKRATHRRATNGQTPAEALDWRHDPERWGMPQQSWSVPDKIVWLLHVVKTETLKSELTAYEIEATFNKHFKQAKPLLVRHIFRELNRLKTDGQIAEDTTLTPSTWYLVQAGEQKAQAIISKLLGNASS